MAHIVVFAPELQDGVTGEIDAGDAVVIGRYPSVDAQRVKERLQQDARVERIPLASMSVSANHALVESTPDQLLVTDLGSRNGTWLRVPPAGRVAIDPEVEELQILVGGKISATSRSEEQEFPSPTWTGQADFGSAIAIATRDWLARRAPAPEVFLSPSSSGPMPPGAIRIPLPEGESLEVRLDQTTDEDWPRRLSQLFGYVSEQRKLLEAEVDARADGMVLASSAIRLVYRQVLEAASRGHRLMLLGPSGSGKELLARAYHRHSARSGPLVSINCAELDERVRAELFGTEPGAFTDAVRRVGAVETANGGTLFLDEVGELSLATQANLLRFLDSGEFTRMGAIARPRHSDVRVVCATNRDLRQQVREGRFRLDLWFRLASHVVEVPPLHQRHEDLEGYLRARKHPGAGSIWAALSPDAMALVREYRWDGRWGGNFRELENFAARLPESSGPGEIDAPTCRRAIEAGAVEPSSLGAKPRSRRDRAETGTWQELVVRAAELAAGTYLEDHGDEPADWNSVKDYIENHLKPVLFARMAGVSDAPSLEAARRESGHLGVDRATRAKQLHRYFERFTPKAAEGG